MPIWNRNRTERRITLSEERDRYHRPRRRQVYPPQHHPHGRVEHHLGDLGYPPGERARRYRPDLEQSGGPFRGPFHAAPRPHPAQQQHGRRWEDPREDSFDFWETRWSENPPAWEEVEEVPEKYHDISNLPGFFPGERRTPDEDIRGDIYELLSVNRYIFAPDVDVSVRNGYVRLTGVVRSQREKEIATRVAQMVNGVRGVDNRLDTEI